MDEPIDPAALAYALAVLRADGDADAADALLAHVRGDTGGTGARTSDDGGE